MRPAIRSTFDVISWLEARSVADEVSLNPSALMKLLYLGQALYASDNKKTKLMPATFLATDVGPIIPDVFLAMEHGVKISDPVEPTPVIEELLSAIWTTYSGLTETELDKILLADMAIKAAKDRGRNSEISMAEMAKAYPGGIDALQGQSLISKFPDGSPYKMEHSNLDAVPSANQEVRFTADGRSVTKWVPKKKVRSKDLKSSKN